MTTGEPDLEGLESLGVVLTSDCNLSCAYCYQTRKHSASMAWATLRAAVELLLRSRQPELTLSFTGGEPLLRFSLVRRAVEYAKSSHRADGRLRFGITSNGVLLDDSIAAFLAEERFDTRLSFDGLPASQDRRGHRTFSLLDRWLDRFKSHHPRFFERSLEIAITLTGANLPHLAQSVDYFLEKGVRRLHVTPSITPDPGWRRESANELDRQFQRVFESCLRLYETAGRVPLQLFRKGRGRPPSRDRGGFLCNLGGGASLCVDVDGQVACCTTLLGSYQELTRPALRRLAEATRLGDVRDHGLRGRLANVGSRLEAGELIARASDYHSSRGPCRDCRWLGECNVCPASVWHADQGGESRRVPDFQCAFNRVSLACRERFPRQPDAGDVVGSLLEGAPATDIARQLIAFSRSRTGDWRPDGTAAR